MPVIRFLRAPAAMLLAAALLAPAVLLVPAAPVMGMLTPSASSWP